MCGVVVPVQPCKSLTLALFCLGAWLRVAAARSYYDELDLTRDASVADVRRQFRKLSVKLHPDKNPSADTPAGRAAFARLQAANEWLGSDDKRQLYDLYGEWGDYDDAARGRQFSDRHKTIEFFKDDDRIKNVNSEAAAQTIFGMKASRAYIMLLYIPWLTPCVEFVDVYRKVARALEEQTGEGEKGIRLGAVNCESKLQRFCMQYGRLRSQFDLPVVLLVDPTETLVDRYRGGLGNARELVEYAIASDRGIRHVHTLDQQTFQATLLNPAKPSEDFWLVLFCTKSNPACTEVKPILKRLAYSARTAAKVGLVNCKEKRGDDGYPEIEPFCEEQGARDVPLLAAYRRGSKGERGEVIELFDETAEGGHVTPTLVLRAMEAILRLTAASASDDAGETDEEVEVGAEDRSEL